MAEYEIKVSEALLSNLFACMDAQAGLLSGGKEGLGELVESVLKGAGGAGRRTARCRPLRAL